ncbi:MAG TPA: dicarboxylate/amino acid:cation symporter, partial [Gemmatimonadales bacterium]|nr:dicarboxylate/amino acid:cation symporter [Gemmatimonadales bacterium]
MTEAPGRGMALHTKILIGLVLGAIGGTVSNLVFKGTPELMWVVDNVLNPIGQVFLRMLFMVVIPLVFTSVTLGVASLGDPRRIGRIGLKTLGFFLITTALAAAIGLMMVNLIQPGLAIDQVTRDALMTEFSGQAGERVQQATASRFGIDTFVSIVTRNPVKSAADGDMLGLIFFSLVFGIALTLLPEDRSSPVLKLLDGIAGAVMVMIGFAMKLAPIGVFGLIFTVTAKFGWQFLQSLLLYVVTVLGGLLLHQFIVIPLLARFLANVGPGEFIRGVRELVITAFSTSSSNATLPTTIKTATRNFGVPREIAGFVLPLGATMNMNGTALFEGMTVLFLAQVFGITLGLPTQIIVVVMAVITAVGVAGVPSGSIPLLVMVLG